MKKLFSLFLLIFISTSIYAYDAGLLFGLDNSFEVEAVRMKNTTPFALTNQSIGAYYSLFFCSDESELGFALADTFSVNRASASSVISNRLLLGSAIIPFADRTQFNIIPGVIIQPEYEDSSTAESTRCLMGLGLDIQLLTNTGSGGIGFGCALSLSSYPIIFGEIKQNGRKSKINVVDYSKFRIGFSVGISLASSHARP